jgi:hypothetical protein
VSHNLSDVAFSMDVVGVVPRRVDVDAITADLNLLGDRRQQYAAVLGTLALVVRKLAQGHGHCVTPRCHTCWELRYASAALSALPFDHYSFRKLREAIR